MNKHIKITIFLLIIFQATAQQTPLLDASNHWILVNNKIERNEIYLTSYKKAKVKLNTLVLSFAENGKIVYDYETNSKYDGNSNIKYLDINTKESSWVFDTLTKTLALTIQAGYETLDDFKFQRTYKIDEVYDGYVLMKTKDVFYENFRKKPLTVTQVRKPTTVGPPIPKKTLIVEKQIITNRTAIVDTSKVIESVAEEIKVDNVITTVTEVKNTIIEPEKPLPVLLKINYLELYKDLFNNDKRWILVRNKIERGDIYLTPYQESKLTINNLVMNLSSNGKIEYDYESDPKIKFCAGVDFLDIDTDETSWTFNADNNVFTLILKGGYASLDDFKFKRDYVIEAFDDGFALRRIKEHYFNDFRKPIKTTRNYQRRKK